jgi:hypothetical protein
MPQAAKNRNPSKAHANPASLAGYPTSLLFLVRGSPRSENPRIARLMQPAQSSPFKIKGNKTPCIRLMPGLNGAGPKASERKQDAPSRVRSRALVSLWPTHSFSLTHSHSTSTSSVFEWSSGPPGTGTARFARSL